MINLMRVFSLVPVRCPDLLKKIRDKHGRDVEPDQTEFGQDPNRTELTGWNVTECYAKKIRFRSGFIFIYLFLFRQFSSHVD